MVVHVPHHVDRILKLPGNERVPLMVAAVLPLNTAQPLMADAWDMVPRRVDLKTRLKPRVLNPHPVSAVEGLLHKHQNTVVAAVFREHVTATRTEEASHLLQKKSVQRQSAEWMASLERAVDRVRAGTAADGMENVFDHWDLGNTNLLKMATSTQRKVDDSMDLSEDCIDEFFEFETEQPTAVPVS